MISIATDSDLGHLRLLLRRLLPSCFFRDAVVVIGLAQGQHKNRPTQCTRSGYIPLHQLEKKCYIRSIPSLALRSGKFLPWRHRLCWSLKRSNESFNVTFPKSPDFCDLGVSFKLQLLESSLQGTPCLEHCSLNLGNLFIGKPDSTLEVSNSLNRNTDLDSNSRFFSA